MTEVIKDPIPARGPALLYFSDEEPPTITRLDTADEQDFSWLDRRSLLFIQALLTDAQARLSVYREDIGK